MAKIVISGYGRCGTSFLTDVLNSLGFQTNIPSNKFEEYRKHVSRAGLELVNGDAEVVKYPGWFMFNLKPEYDYRANKDKKPIEIDSLKNIELCIIPIRGISKAYASRKYCAEVLKSDCRGGTAGGQINESLLAEHLGWDIDYCVMNNIPFVFLKYPDFTKDIDYFYNQLKVIFEPKNIKTSDIKKVFDTIGIKESRV